MSRKAEPISDGTRFGRLMVVSFAGPRDYGTYVRQMYVCRCDCGRLSNVSSADLRKGTVKSCGCLRRELARSRNTTHGLSRDPRYEMWYNASRRDKDFALEIQDIHIPATCPILGIPLVKGNKTMTDNSPSLDRVDSSKGYTKDNIRVISFRANRLKNSFSIEEMEAALKYMRDGTETYIKKE